MIIVLSRKLKPSIVGEGYTFGKKVIITRIIIKLIPDSRVAKVTFCFPGQRQLTAFFQPFPQCHPLFYCMCESVSVSNRYCARVRRLKTAVCALKHENEREKRMSVGLSCLKVTKGKCCMYTVCVREVNC